MIIFRVVYILFNVSTHLTNTRPTLATPPSSSPKSAPDYTPKTNRPPIPPSNFKPYTNRDRHLCTFT